LMHWCISTLVHYYIATLNVFPLTKLLFLNNEIGEYINRDVKK
jgi:hypothetical protein